MISLMLNRDFQISLKTILRTFSMKISVTWMIVGIENILLALIPLFIGFTIDGLLSGSVNELFLLCGILVGLGIVSVARRIYDTRAYSMIRLHIGMVINEKFKDLDVSKVNARINMSRELVDFLEEDVPNLITAIVQIIISLCILTIFDIRLGISSVIVVVSMVLLYGLFHQRFFALNAAINEQHERQVSVLNDRKKLGVFKYFRALRKCEIRLSDTEAYLYGSIFLLQIIYFAYNLYISTELAGITAGKIFSIATYSWEYVEAALMLPIALQSLSRLSEIIQRINTPIDSSSQSTS